MSTRYDNVAIALHWTIALLMICMLALGFFMGGFPPPLRFTAIDLHKATGITVLGLSAFRLVWRLLNPPPLLPETTVPARRRPLVHLVHWSLYALMILMPLTGWLFTSAGAKYPIHYYGLGDIPFLPMPADEALRKMLGADARQLHTIFGYAALVLIAGHIGAALWHQCVRQDGLLKRMWP